MSLDRKPVTVWDWFKAGMPGLSDSAVDADAATAARLGGESPPARVAEPARPRVRMQAWRGLHIPLAFLLALGGQFMLSEPDQPQWLVGTGLYVVAAVLLGLGVWQFVGEDRRDADDPDADAPDVDTGQVVDDATPQIHVRMIVVGVAALFAAATYLFAGNNNMGWLAWFTWVASIVAMGIGLWGQPLALRLDWRSVLDRVWNGTITITMQRTLWLLLAVMIAGAFFRFFQLDALPGEMTSDHIEKVLDVQRILEGMRPIFLANNGGRESLGFYLMAGTAWLLRMDPSHLSIKIFTSVVGWLTIPVVFLLAREVSDEDDTAGLTAAALMAIGWWPTTIARNGLRFPLAPFFTALTLFFLVRGLRRKRPADFVWAGLFLGLGVYGYTPSRLMPLGVLLVAVLFAIHTMRQHGARFGAWSLIASGVMSMVVAVPLFRYVQDYPDFFLYRTVTRMTGAEVPLPGPPLLIFAQNAWDALRMFSVTFDVAWLVSPPSQPALGWITGALFHMGVVVLLVRWWRTARWQDLALVLLVPMLLIPSMLALAFPIENPSLHRGSMAIPVVFTIAGVGLAWLIHYFIRVQPGRVGEVFAAVVAGLLLVGGFNINRTVFFEDYADSYWLSTQNASDMGEVIEKYATTIGSYDTAWVIAYPYWVDTRGVGIEAGDPWWNNVILDAAALDATVNEPRTKLFIVHPDDAPSAGQLLTLYPNAVITHWQRPAIHKSFYIYLVPGEGDIQLSTETLTSGLSP